MYRVVAKRESYYIWRGGSSSAATYEIKLFLACFHVTTCVDFITFTKVSVIYIFRDNLLNIHIGIEFDCIKYYVILCAVTPLKQCNS